MEKSITVRKETKYGKDYIYPHDEQAQGFCKLLGGQKSLTAQNIIDIKALGYVVRLVQKQPSAGGVL